MTNPKGKNPSQCPPADAPASDGVAGAEPFISKREVARRLERTPRTVEGLMRRGIIPYYKLGYRVAFRWSEIQEHLAQTCRVYRGRAGRAGGQS
jgi:excisionase family DNA binding protein